MGMGGISIWQLVIVVMFIIIPVWIWGRIANKAGYSRWWVALMFIPLVNLIMIWVFAFANWPALEQAEEQKDLLDG